MLSKKCKYAIRAVLYLSSESKLPRELKGGREVSEALNIPLAFTSKILQELAREQVISSVKGPGGGFYLNYDNLQNPLLKIVDVIDGLEFFTSCGLGLPQCSQAHPCPVHQTFTECRSSLLKMLKSKKIKDLGQEIIEGDLFVVR